MKRLVNYARSGCNWHTRPLSPTLAASYQNGKLYVMKCNRCQKLNPAGARFCNACGVPLHTSMPATTPRSYTPAHLAERILTSRSGIEGERKQITVLFADVKGSMELLAD